MPLPTTATPLPGSPGNGPDQPGMHPLAKFEADLLKVFRMDLQLHFFWSFMLTLLGMFWLPMLTAGLLITVLKEALDWVALKGWSWGDFWFGVAGAMMALAFVYFLDREIFDLGWIVGGKS